MEPKVKEKVTVHNTAYVTKVTPIEFCGKTVMLQLYLSGVYTVPFEIKPTPGKHDYNGCPPCQEKIIKITRKLTERLEGSAEKKGFPFCCEGHSNLVNLKEFKRQDFEGVPNLVARKIVYTIQHFINISESANWRKDASDYLEWVLISFGSMPKDCGEPLFLTSFFSSLEESITNNENLPVSQKQEINKMLAELQSRKVRKIMDINILSKTYEKWINIFPFELTSYFGDTKEKMTNKLLLWKGKPEVNPYSGLTKREMHTKESLIEELIGLTNKLLTEINGVALYEKGIVTDTNKIRLELLINERKAKLKQGYKSNSAEEYLYRKMIREWFEDEKKFFAELTPLLKGVDPLKPKGRTITASALTISLFCYLVNESKVDVRSETETILTYCKRICRKYDLKFSDRVRQGFSTSYNKRNLQKVINHILPKIHNVTRDQIEAYLDNKQSTKQKMYG